MTSTKVDVPNWSQDHHERRTRAAHVQAFARQGGPPGAARFAVLDVIQPRPDLDHPLTVVTWTLARETDGWWVLARQSTPVL